MFLFFRTKAANRNRTFLPLTVSGKARLKHIRRAAYGTAALLCAAGLQANPPPTTPAVLPGRGIGKDGAVKIQARDLPYSAFASPEARDKFASAPPYPYPQGTDDAALIAWRRSMDEQLFVPQLTEAILAGTQRGGLDGTLLLATGAVDPGWDVQARGLLPRAGGPGAAVPISVGQAPLRLLTENR